MNAEQIAANTTANQILWKHEKAMDVPKENGRLQNQVQIQLESKARMALSALFRYKQVCHV